MAPDGTVSFGVGDGFQQTPTIARLNPAQAKRTTIGKLTITLKGGRSKKVRVKRNAKGRKLLKKVKRFKARLIVTRTVSGKQKPKTVLKARPPPRSLGALRPHGR